MGAVAPRFRRDLAASLVEADGVAYVEVTDERNRKSFRFYDFEFAVAQRLDGRSLDEVAADLRTQSELDLTGEQLAAFADQLRSLGFLVDEAAEAAAPSVFPPLVDDESGAFDTTGLLGAQAPARPGATPAPPADPVPDLARSVTEQTITSFPPDVRPAGWSQAAAADRTEPVVARAPGADSDGRAQPRAAEMMDEDTTPVQPPVPVSPFPVAVSALEVPVAVPLADTAPIMARTAPPTATAAPPASPQVEPADEQAEDISDELADALVEDMDRKAESFVADAPAEATVRDEQPETSDTIEAKAPDFADTTPATEAGPRRNGQALAAIRAVVGEPAATASNGAGAAARSAADADRDEETPVAPLPAPPARALSSGNLTPAASSGRPSWPAYAALAIAAAAIIAAVVYKFVVNPEPPAITVRIVVPSPTTHYRYFEGSARVERVEAPAFAFASDGKLAEIAAPGTRYNAGDVLALLEAGRRPRAELTHNRERLAHYERQRDEATRQNKRGEARVAERKIAEKQKLITEGQASLARFAVLALQGGEIAEALATVGSAVKANEPVLRAKGQSYRAVFELPSAEAQKARQMGFCRLEMDGNPLECSLAAEGGDDTHLVVDLPNDPQVGAGKTVRLARDRLDGVFPVPAAALQHVGDSDRLYVVGGNGRAELRVVGVQDRNATEVIVAQGLDVGDRVIVNNPPGLKPDARLLIAETKTK